MAEEKDGKCGLDYQNEVVQIHGLDQEHSLESVEVDGKDEI